MKVLVITGLFFLSAAAYAERDLATSLPGKPTPENLILSDCNCNLAFIDEGKIAYEDVNTCAPDRRYLEPSLKEMPDWIKEVRNPFPEAKFGRECVVLVQKTFLSSAQKVRSSLFATCPTPAPPKKGRKAAPVSNQPRRKAKIACVTQDYANSVYNALVDVSDCLNMNQHDMVAKLYNESGLHMNTFGGGGDTGIGQLTGSAIEAALEPYWKEGGRITVRDYYLAEVGKSSKPSCQRIINFPAAFQKVNPSMSNRCSLIKAPENPYRNLLYTGLFYRVLLHQIAGIKYQSGKDYVLKDDQLQEVLPDQDFEPGGLIQEFKIKANLQRLGIKNPDMHAVTRALLILGYNAGPKKGAIYLDVYLRKRIGNGKRPVMLKPEDVDFLKTDFIPRVSKLVGPIAKENSKAKPAVLAARKSAHLKSLPEFFMLIQDSGAPGYVSRVADKHKELIKLMGDERCVSKGFIHF